MNKRGNLFEMLLLERGFPSWNESLNLSRREKGGVVSRSRFPQEIVTHIRGQSPARHVLARSQFHRSFHTGWSVFLSSKLLSFRISRFEINSFSSFLRFIFLFFLFQLSTRCSLRFPRTNNYSFLNWAFCLDEDWYLKFVENFQSVSSMIATIKDPITRRIYDF